MTAGFLTDRVEQGADGVWRPKRGDDKAAQILCDERNAPPAPRAVPTWPADFTSGPDPRKEVAP